MPTPDFVITIIRRMAYAGLEVQHRVLELQMGSVSHSRESQELGEHVNKTGFYYGRGRRGGCWRAAVIATRSFLLNRLTSKLSKASLLPNPSTCIFSPSLGTFFNLSRSSLSLEHNLSWVDFPPKTLVSPMLFSEHACARFGPLYSSFFFFFK